MWSGDPALTPWLNRPLCILLGQKFIFFCGKNASGKRATLNQYKHRNDCLSKVQHDFFLHMKVKSAASKHLKSVKDALRWKVYHLSDFMAWIKVRKREKTESKLQDSRTLSDAHAGCAAKWQDRMNFQDISYQSVSVWTYQVFISQLKLPTTKLCQSLLGINGKQLFPQRKKRPWILPYGGHVIQFW